MPNVNSQVAIGGQGFDSSRGGSGSSAKTVASFLLFVMLGIGGGYVYGPIVGFIGLLVTALFYFSIVINQEYERAVVFRLGSYDRVLGPGLNFKIPFFEWVEKIDYRVKSTNVEPQKVLTKDNVTVQVDAIVYYRVRKEDDEVAKALLEVEDFNQVTVRYAQTKLRDLVGSKELDTILQKREEVANELEEDLDKATNDFGVKIRDVELQDVSIPNEMERAMAAQAEAERNRRAKIKEAQGELQAAARMRAASDILGKRGYQLRTLETLDNVAQENSTILTIPAELMPSEATDEEESPVQNIVDNVLENVDLDDLVQESKDITEIAEE
ncbi:MAG: SPFH domain-containing protein [Candidatus Nanohaloarchaeota archaeon QJJ-9]|nr:SPFH domain-containing protein [Candidatus Nanohaloarchaeota archaeon QJJ-9]